MINQPPDGIVVTLPVVFLLDLLSDTEKRSWEHSSSGVPSQKVLIQRGYKKLVKEMKWIMKDPDDCYWMHSLGTKPTLEVEYVYMTVLGKIKWRGNILRWEPGHTKNFPDGRKCTAKHWLYLCNIIPAPADFPFKGCQGFRYTHKLF